MRALQEPSPVQRMVEARHAVRQLQRRPAPEVPVPNLPWAYLNRATDITSIATGTSQFVSGYDTSGTNDATTFDLDPTNGWLGITVTGVYVVSATSDWQIATTSRETIVNFGVTIVRLGPAADHQTDGTKGTSGVTFLVVVTALGATPEEAFSMNVRQNSGSSRDLNNARIGAVRLADL